MLTRVSRAAAWRVAYTTPPIIAVWITSDVKPTRSHPWLRVFRLNSRSEKTTDPPPVRRLSRSEEHTSELQSRLHLVCRLLLEKKKKEKKKTQKYLINK